MAAPRTIRRAGKMSRHAVSLLVLPCRMAEKTHRFVGDDWR
jgi:hypothetical protein